MFPQKLLPPALRSAPVEEQLSYLLQRRRTIERLLKALETYSQNCEGPHREERGANQSCEAA
jgi:hypothetical protein